MKNNTLYRILVAVCLMLPLVSCVREEKDIFDKSASERMNEWLVSTQNVLTSAANGWVMHYYPEGNQIYPGLYRRWRGNRPQRTVRRPLHLPLQNGQ